MKIDRILKAAQTFEVVATSLEELQEIYKSLPAGKSYKKIDPAQEKKPAENFNDILKLLGDEIEEERIREMLRVLQRQFSHASSSEKREKIKALMRKLQSLLSVS